MLKKLLNRLIVYIFDVIEQEQKRRKLELLLQLMEEKEKREKEIQDKRDEQARINAKFRLAELEKRQANCKHLKGNTGVLLQHMKDYMKDYNVIQHTMPDGRVVIKCVICGKEWSKATGNLKEGFDMMRYSTNTATSSEVSLGKLKDQDKVMTDAQKAVAEAANKRPSPWGDQENDVLFPWAGKNWPTIWEKGLAKLKRAAARKKKVKVQ